jgi:hypothetical protein
MSSNASQQTFTRNTSSGGSHSHHWKLEEVQGPSSTGRCKTCGAIREFNNCFEQMPTRSEREFAA